MAIKLRNDSVSDIFILKELIERYMEENSCSLLDVNDEVIQRQYDEINTEMEKELE